MAGGAGLGYLSLPGTRLKRERGILSFGAQSEPEPLPERELVLDGETLIDPSLFRADLVVADTVYNPKETRMILEAKAAGVKAAIGGIGMLLRQGVEGFRLYTGREMPADEVMDKFFA